MNKELSLANNYHTCRKLRTRIVRYIFAAPADNFKCEYFEKKLFENGDFESLTVMLQTWPDQPDHPLP